MDSPLDLVTVARPEDDWQIWTLADLLGRPVGHITKHAGPRFIIEPDPRMRSAMIDVAPGPYASLDEALTEIETRTSLVCRHASGEK